MDHRRYQRKGAIGAGGFGSVTEVHDKFLDRDVLYKSMHDPQNNAQLLTEVSALVKARSRHIIEIYDKDVDEKGDLVGIFIEKADGRDFLEFHSEASGDPLALLKIIYQVSSGVADLHAAGIVHRDLKLENFKESSSKIVKLFDFGISSLNGPHVTTRNRGTIEYAAPELFQDNATLTSATDVYALGICCWKLIAETLPQEFQDVPPQSRQRAPSISTVAPYLPAQVADLIDRCVLPAAEDRATASALRDACEINLVKGRHKGRFTSSRNSEIYELSQIKPNVKINTHGNGEVRAAYSGTDFVITGFTGDVFINNLPASVGTALPNSCVITLGDFSKGADRTHISFLCSKPEIVL